MTQLIDKQRVASSFSKAAHTYDSVAELQREVGSALLQYLPQQPQQRIMDLGSGTGYFTPELVARYPDAQLINLDLAFGMLSYARSHRFAEQASWLCADAEALPLASGQVDLIFSSLAIQWCEDLPQLLREINRVLSPGGRFVVATLGPETLSELRYAWQQADDYTHVNQFLPAEALHQALPPGLRCVQLDQVFKVLKYAQLKQLTDELKGLGAHNMNSGQQTGLTGRARIKRFKEAYEARRHPDGYLPATYQVYYAVFERAEQE
ncbi:malonyl-ACP O-methyltransferase BioC [Neptuniibacter halophilus]|uniref:malonyl-ACP O-methyltransferase BioC n=1 Tax=Neptuniibacter halophilus TaxID=651666 RepID=UPI002572FEA2|nr:malonyl-ACP O-methyltransferase BioC [Neptuniibacter halophilus]